VKQTRRRVGGLLLILIIASLASVARTGTPQLQPSLRGIASPAPNEGAFLMLSDIHFDALTGTDASVVRRLMASPVEKWQAILDSSTPSQMSPNGSDSNYALLASAINAAAHSGAHYDYIVITGDFLGHNYLRKYRQFKPDGKGYQAFVIKTIAFVNRMVEGAFPHTPIYQALGNNDSVEADYSAPGRPLLVALAKDWKAVARNDYARNDFLIGGYYSLPHPFVPSQRLIVLNTAFWSAKYTDSSNRTTGQVGEDPGLRELAWLESQLDRLQAEHKTAALLMHIPPSVDAYTSAQSGDCAPPVLFWKQSKSTQKTYLDSFLEILDAHRAGVRDGYAGHTHMDNFLVVDDARRTPYFQVHIIPSISRDHGNNPAFEIGLYDKNTGALTDYSATYLRTSSSADQPGDWEPEYDFREISHFPSYSPNSLKTIALLIRSNEVVREKFLDFYSARASAGQALPAKNWLSYSCAQTELTPAAFGKCVCPLPPSTQVP
jgi:sphingomyelin phosphodiesterase acid-like 3